MSSRNAQKKLRQRANRKKRAEAAGVANAATVDLAPIPWDGPVIYAKSYNIIRIPGGATLGLSHDWPCDIKL